MERGRKSDAQGKMGRVRGAVSERGEERIRNRVTRRLYKNCLILLKLAKTVI